MSAITSYASATPATGDKVLGTDATDGSSKNFTVDALSTLHWTAPTLTGAVDLGAGGVTIGNADLAINTTAFTVDGSASKVAIGLATGGGDGTLHVHTATCGAIAAASNADDLVVENSTDAGISILSPSTDTGRINFGNNADASRGSIVYDHSTHGLAFTTFSTLGMTLTGSQQVGIGTASPDGTLHVHTATAGAVTASTSADELVIENSTYCGLSILAPSTAWSMIAFGDESANSVGTIIYDHTADSLALTANTSSAVYVNSAGDWLPSVTETQDLGSASLEWDNLYVQNAVTVSDLRRKENITDILDPLTFVNSLRPVQYNLKDTVVPEVPAVLFAEGEEIVRAKSAVTDEEGNIVEPAVEQVLATGTEVREEAIPEKTITHSRPHTGFIAQEVKAAMGENDWAGYAYDEDSDTHMLRLSEFVGYLVGAVKELTAKVEALEA